MWKRLDLLWTAFEKFALLFSFVATLTLIVGVVLIYDAITDLEIEAPRTVGPEHLDPLFDLTSASLQRIQDAKLVTEVEIDHTVPVTFTVRLNPSDTSLALVGTNQLDTGQITIYLRNGAGQLIGESATMQIAGGNTVTVKMDVAQEVAIDVPVQVKVPVQVSLDSIDLQPLIEDLKQAKDGVHAQLSPPVPAAGTIER
ncbi:MAG: hypothetical protein JXA09_05480 [Anaerolineae bacterium]|nr:hypothetical protein [Anaerolineae bacterium]